jgi:hypothetical protein
MFIGSLTGVRSGFSLLVVWNCWSGVESLNTLYISVMKSFLKKGSFISPVLINFQGQSVSPGFSQYKKFKLSDVPVTLGFEGFIYKLKKEYTRARTHMHTRTCMHAQTHLLFGVPETCIISLF